MQTGFIAGVFQPTSRHAVRLHSWSTRVMVTSSIDRSYDLRQGTKATSACATLSIEVIL
jgi:hypothetical protein